MEFDYRIFNYEMANMSIIGLSPDSVSANAALKRDKEVRFPLLSDSKGDLINAMGFNISKGSNKVGVFAIDKERTLLAHRFGKMDNVLDQLDRDMDAIIEAIEESRQNEAED